MKNVSCGVYVGGKGGVGLAWGRILLCYSLQCGLFFSQCGALKHVFKIIQL